MICRKELCGLFMFATAVGCMSGAQADPTAYYWQGLGSATSSRSTGGHSGSSGSYYWTDNPDNFCDASRGKTITTVPRDGDILLLIASYWNRALTPQYSVGYSRVELSAGNSTTAGGVKIVNQGDFVLLGGGDGLKVTATTDIFDTFECDFAIRGAGDTPIDIPLPGQKLMIVKSTSGDGTLVKKGLGTLVLGDGYHREGDRPEQVALGTYGWYRAIFLPEIKVCEGTLEVDNFFIAQKTTFAFSGNDESAVLKLDQTLHVDGGDLREYGVANHVHAISSDVAAQLHFIGTPKSDSIVFTGRFAGQAGLAFEPSGSGYEFVCSGGCSDTTGSLGVMNGTVRLTDGAAFTDLSSVVVADGGCLRLEEGASIRAQSIEVAEGSVLALSGDSILRTGALMVNGNSIGTGCYRGEDWIEGDGVVLVGDFSTPVTAVWTGAKGTDWLDPENWQAESVPDLTNGLALIRIVGGTGMTLPNDRQYAISGIELVAGVSEFVFASAEGAKPLMLTGDSSFGSSMGTNEWGWAVYLAEGQAWSVANGGVLAVKAPISGPRTSSFVKTGTGRMDLLCENFFAGDFTAPDSFVWVCATNALGAAGGKVHVDMPNNVTQFRFVNPQSQVREIEIDCSSASQPATFFVCDSYRGDRMVFRGRVSSVNSSAAMTLNVGSGEVEFLDGVTCRGLLTLYGSGTVRIKGDVLYNRDRFTFKDHTTTLELHVPANRLNGNMGNMKGQGKIIACVPYALDATTTPIRVSTDAYQPSGLCIGKIFTIDLNGFDQALGNLDSREGGIVTSARPATFHLVANQDFPSYDASYYDRVGKATFTGAANFSKEGVNPHWLMAESSSTGRVEVTAGTLTLASGEGGDVTLATGVTYPRSTGAWPLASAAVAKGSGVLVIEHSAAIGRKTDVCVEGDGVVELASGVNQRCHALYFDGKEQDPGTWGSPESAAAHKSSRFAGTGVLTVHGTSPGFIMLLR